MGFLDDVHIDLPGGGGRRRRPVRPVKKKLPVSTGPARVRVVIWHVIKCPKCKSKNVRCYATKRPLRYHKCKDCGYSFKSVEQ